MAQARQASVADRMCWLQDRHDFELPEEVLRLAAQLEVQNQSEWGYGYGHGQEVPADLKELAARHGLVARVGLAGPVYDFEKKCSVKDPISKIARIENLGLEGVEGLETIGDLLKLLQAGFGILPYLKDANSDEVISLHEDLVLHGLIDS